ncbi:hypothetical protein O1611_g2118 [Lasiodiplodia mahajangana]|uniref:Uncharacterized protein n=1 Tax=Lasiodiplodia mahajangana TaxID=1108764 RepID=A0ACC2JVS8_9PEZI|nr:hypothetical protein O1611_g2118 [Lasiodiplodia mahajangana]
MDPVSAVGVAAAALQFLDASIKAYSVFQEIRKSAESATERNMQLENNLQSAQSLRNSLASSPSPQGATDPVSKLTVKCTSEADELLGLLKYVRGYGEDISSIRATFRAARKEKRIKELHGSLKEDQNTLNQMISETLLPSINSLTVLQSNEFANINSTGQKLIKEQIEQRKIQEDRHTIVAGGLDSIQHNMQLRNNTDDQARLWRELLESLWFPEIDQRQNQIKEPAPSTLDWLFTPPKLESGSGEDEDRETDSEWSNFKEWLCQDTSTYWISGKAGSGKSTLMAHIVDDRRTHEFLGTWSSGYELKVLSFFFWRAGSSLQNSVLGLLRSILYQLCVSQPAITDHISSSLPSSIGIPTWTEKRLLNTIAEVIQTSQGFRFCIFIDGLDEYTDPYDYLLDCIEKLQSCGNVKSCVSSRPELELVMRFQSVKQLRLQDLNRADIKKFVKQTLARTQLSEHQRSHLIRKVVERSEGVFLWASLVTQSLVKGSKAGDDEEIMQRRLESLPRDMNQLFERMLSEVEPVYQKSLDFYIQLMVLAKGDGAWPILFHSVAVITTSLLTKEINTYEEFSEECDRTKTQITTQSAGLLEIFNMEQFMDEAKYEWDQATFHFASDQLDFTSEFASLNRHRCGQNVPYPTIFVYEGQHIAWIHRSAFEFLSNQKIVPVEFGSSSEGVFRQISEGWMRFIRAAPSVDYQNTLPKVISTSYRLSRLFSFIRKRYKIYPKTGSALLDKLHSIYEHGDPYELRSYDTGPWAPSDIHESTGETEFWSECAKHGLVSYIYSRVDHILEGTDREPVIARLLFHLLWRWRADSDYEYTGTGNFTSLVNNLADGLYKCTIQRLNIGGAAQSPRWKCIAPYETRISSIFPQPRVTPTFSCATWKEPAVGGSLGTIVDLLNIVSIIQYHSRPHPLRGSTTFSTLMDATGLYVALKLGLRRVYIQLSGKAYMAAGITLDKLEGVLGSCVRAAEFDGAVRILCAPWLKTQEDWRPDPELGYPQFVTLQPSNTTSDQLLNLIHYRVARLDDIGFNMIQNMRQHREKVCENLIREIKSAEQGLDGGQQLIAAACVKAGFLYSDDEYTYNDTPEETDDEYISDEVSEGSDSDRGGIIIDY